MTDRIYTIPARELVQGLRLLVDGVPRGKILRVWGHKARTSALVGNAQWIWVSDTLVTVRLPGSSPREVLCTCITGDGLGTWQCVIDHRNGEGIEGHRNDCLVRKMRLRLWPVGATWNWASRGWLVPVGEHDQAYVLPRDVCNNFADMMDHAAASLRTAFCEPDPTT